MNNMTEKISVLMSVYNAEDTLEKSIESILNQSYKNLEFLIIDDGSNDSTFSKINKLAKENNKIRIFKNEKNKGLTHSLNFLIGEADGNYLARQDADDISLFNRFEEQLNLIKLKKLDFCTTRAYKLNSKTKIPGISTYIPYEILIKYKNPFIHGSLVIKKSTMLEIGCYNKKFIYAQDYKLFSDLLNGNYRYSVINNPLYILNMTNNISTIKKEEQKYYANCVKRNEEPKS